MLSGGMIAHPLLHHPMSALFTRDRARSRRASSWDRSGGNRDFIFVAPGDTAVLMEARRARAASRTSTAPWSFPTRPTIATPSCAATGTARTTPSVEVPLGDFFCLSHARVRLLQQRAGLGQSRASASSHGLNAYFPMPFATAARASRSRIAATGRSAACSRRSGITSTTRPTTRRRRTTRCASTRSGGRSARRWPSARSRTSSSTRRRISTAPRTTSRSMPPAPARWSALHLQIHNIAGGWYGEGDDMVFIDGETWPPSIHGTGTEEIFGGGACPAAEYAAHVSWLPPDRITRLLRPDRRLSLVRPGSDPLRRDRCAGRSSTATPTTSPTSTRRSPTGISRSRTRRFRRLPTARASRRRYRRSSKVCAKRSSRRWPGRCRIPRARSFSGSCRSASLSMRGATRRRSNA